MNKRFFTTYWIISGPIQKLFFCKVVNPYSFFSILGQVTVCPQNRLSLRLRETQNLPRKRTKNSVPDGVGRGLGRRKEDYFLKASYINMNIIHIILYAYTSNLLNKNCNLDFLNRICLDFKVHTNQSSLR